MQIMPFEDAKTYRSNPFDLTKVWPHEDYPLIKVGTMTLNRNLTDFHTGSGSTTSRSRSTRRRRRSTPTTRTAAAA